VFGASYFGSSYFPPAYFGGNAPAIGVRHSGRLYQRRIMEINGMIYGTIPGLFGKVTGTVDPYSEEELAMLMMEDLL